jgi:NADPH:quinone reductase-like Zn-dependent oxidoreductase
VLIYGASGTSGTIAIQYAKYLGAIVTGVCGPSHMEFVTSLEADSVLDYTNNESLKHLEEYDLVIDTVGKGKTSELKKACAHALRANGKYISIDDGALEPDRKFVCLWYTLGS